MNKYFDRGSGKQAMMATEIVANALTKTEDNIRSGKLKVENMKQMFLEQDCWNDYQLNIRSQLTNLVGPLARDLLSTPFARGVSLFRDPEDGKTKVRGSISVRSMNAPQAAEYCCFDLPELTPCKTASPVETVCARYCRTLNDELDERFINHRADSLVGRLVGRGVSDAQAQEWLLTVYQILKMAQHLVNGMLTPLSTDYKAFSGLAEVTSQDNGVQHFTASADPLNDLKLIACRTEVISSQFTTDWVIAMSPLAYATYQNAILQYQLNNVLPVNISINANGEFSINGIRVIVDNAIATTDDGTGTLRTDVIIYDRYQIGAYLMFDISNPEIISNTSETNLIVDGCGMVCDLARNRGAVVMGDSAGAFVIENVEIDSACLGGALSGLQNIINPTELFPAIG